MIIALFPPTPFSSFWREKKYDLKKLLKYALLISSWRGKNYWLHFAVTTTWGAVTLHSQLYENRFCDREDFESKLSKNLKNTQGRGITHFLTRSFCMQEYFDQVKHKQVLYSIFFWGFIPKKNSRLSIFHCFLFTNWRQIKSIPSDALR